MVHRDRTGSTQRIDIRAIVQHGTRPEASSASSPQDDTVWNGDYQYYYIWASQASQP
jgi:hypothetical protein